MFLFYCNVLTHPKGLSKLSSSFSDNHCQ